MNSNRETFTPEGEMTSTYEENEKIFEFAESVMDILAKRSPRFDKIDRALLIVGIADDNENFVLGGQIAGEIFKSLSEGVSIEDARRMAVEKITPEYFTLKTESTN